jgi:hypothetical protein
LPSFVSITAKCLLPLVVGSVLLGAQDTARGSAKNDGRVRVAEAYSSNRAGDRAQAAQRLFALGTFAAECQRSGAARVRRLQASAKPPLTLRLRNRFYPDRTFEVLALDEMGRVLPRVPLAIDLVAAPAVLDETSGGVLDGAIVPVRPGMVRFIFSTLCEPAGVETSFLAESR